MRLHRIIRRAGITVLAAAGVAAASALGLSAVPASAATNDLTLTLRFTMVKEGLSRPAASVVYYTPQSYPAVGGSFCNYMTVGQTKDFPITVPKGTWLSLAYSDGCPAYSQLGIRTNLLADRDGQLVQVTLGAGQ